MYTYIYTHTPLKAPTYPFEGLYIALYRALFRGYFCLSFWSQSIGNTKSEKNSGKNAEICFWEVCCRFFNGFLRGLAYPFEGPYIAL